MPQIKRLSVISEKKEKTITLPIPVVNMLILNYIGVVKKVITKRDLNQLSFALKKFQVSDYSQLILALKKDADQKPNSPIRIDKISAACDILGNLGITPENMKLLFNSGE